MAKWNRSPDRVSEAFRRLSEDAEARHAAAGKPPINRPIVVLGVLALALVCAGIVALFVDWLP
jgi:hypothetical protein